MSSNVSLAGDYKSLNAFIVVAEKKYPGVDIKQAIMESSIPGWNMVKQRFIDGGFELALVGDFAEKLDVALQAIAQTARPESKTKHPPNPAPKKTLSKFEQIQLQQKNRREQQRAQIQQVRVVQPAEPPQHTQKSGSKPQLNEKSVVLLRLDQVPPPKI